MMKTICIDPGHGGKDPGAVGPSGLKEKDVVLAVALLLRERLRGRADIRVIMTRESDAFVELGERAAIANRASADLFLSIHCNSAKTPAVGIETWIAPSTKVSFPLAEAIQDCLTAAVPDTPDRGIKRAAFTVLTRTQMPAALAELEFIHVRCGEERLADPEYQRRYADALAAAVLTFLGLSVLPPREDPPESVACAACEGWDHVRLYADRLNELADKFDPR